MMRSKLIFSCLVCLGFLLSGCIVFPYVYDTEPVTTPTDGWDAIETVTFEQTPLPTLDATEMPTEEPTPSPTAEVHTPTVVADPVQYSIFARQDENPFYLPNFAHPEAACEWMGIAGQIFDQDGLEVLGLVVQAGKSLPEPEVIGSSVTGSILSYGLGGYEIQIDEAPIETTETYWVQIMDEDGLVLSEKIYFDTFDDCDLNLIILNWVYRENQPEPKSIMTPEPAPTLEAYP